MGTAAAHGKGACGDNGGGFVLRIILSCGGYSARMSAGRETLEATDVRLGGHLQPHIGDRRPAGSPHFRIWWSARDLLGWCWPGQALGSGGSGSIGTPAGVA